MHCKFFQKEVSCRYYHPNGKFERSTSFLAVILFLETINALSSYFLLVLQLCHFYMGFIFLYIYIYSFDFCN